MAFECPHCHERNCEVLFAGSLQPRGCRFTLSVAPGDVQALNRQLVKSDTATLTVRLLLIFRLLHLVVTLLHTCNGLSSALYLAFSRLLLIVESAWRPSEEFGKLDRCQSSSWKYRPPPSAARCPRRLMLSVAQVEGVLVRTAEELRAMQGERREADPTTAAALDDFLQNVDACARGERPFTLCLDDPAGNSFIENPHAPRPDRALLVEYYDRTIEQNEALGLGPLQSREGGEAEVSPESTPSSDGAAGVYVPAGTPGRPTAYGAVEMEHSIAAGSGQATADALLKYSGPEEVMSFPATCSVCSAQSETRMFFTDIPYFKEVIVMATTCDTCGYRSSEVKAGGRIPDKGKRIVLRVCSKDDLTRDVIKSDTAAVRIPEADVELATGTLGGRVTTVEGLLADIKQNLLQLQAFQLGDSAPTWQRETWTRLDQKLQSFLDLENPWTLELEDPLANSFIAPATGGPILDSQLTVEEVDRTTEQDEDLGIHDMNLLSLEHEAASQSQVTAEGGS
eukprot:SM000003S11243  [mRNA]  locus=s3:1782077:1785543:- [translate_table: standard]